MVLLWNFPWAKICWAILSSQKPVFLGGIHHLEITNSYHRLSAFVCQNPIDLPSSQGAPQRTSFVLHFRPRMSISRARLCARHYIAFLSPSFPLPNEVGRVGFHRFFHHTIRRGLVLTGSSQISHWLRHRHGALPPRPTLRIKPNPLWPPPPSHGNAVLPPSFCRRSRGPEVCLAYQMRNSPLVIWTATWACSSGSYGHPTSDTGWAEGKRTFGGTRSRTALFRRTWLCW